MWKTNSDVCKGTEHCVESAYTDKIERRTNGKGTNEKGLYCQHAEWTNEN